MTQLPLELFSTLASNIANVGTDCGRKRDDETRDAQRLLRQLLLVSRGVYAQVVHHLYRDVLVRDYMSLRSATLDRAKHPLRYARRIHFAYHHPLPEPPDSYTFAQIRPESQLELEVVDLRLPTGEFSPSARASWEDATVQALADSWIAMKEAGTDILPNLERVVLGSLNDTLWDLPRYTSQAVGYWEDSFAQLLCNLPNVRHYCQSSTFGPLCLYDNVIKLSNPPGIATFHYSPDNSPFHHAYSSYPLLVDAINRYIIATPQIIRLAPGTNAICEDPMTVTLALDLIESTLVDAFYRLGAEEGFVPRQQVIDQMANTTIEVYGLVKCVALTDDEHSHPRSPLTESQVRDMIRRPSAPLAPVQEILDSLVRPWRGPVVLKNREETPPCSACDLDCQEQWRRSESCGGGWYVPP